LGVSRGLVQEVFEQLCAEGYLVAVAGSGTRVAPAGADPEPIDNQAAPNERIEVDFSPGRPDLNSFPLTDWTWAWREVARTISPASFGYQDPRGVVELREVLASYLRRVRGCVADPGNLTLCNGFTQGLRLTLEVLRRAGVLRVGVEDPGHPEIIPLVQRSGLQPVAIPVDGGGAIVADLERTGVHAVILTPAHQTPTGVVLSPTRRRELLRWAATQGGFVIEDDYDAEFRYDKKPVGSLQGLSPRNVFSIGSVSKSLGPALRIGWVLAPSSFAEAVAEEKHLADRGSATLDQLILATLISSGRYDRHLRRMRSIYSSRRAALIRALAANAPALTLSGLPAGFHLLALLDDGIDERTVVSVARSRSVALQGLSRYRDSTDLRPSGIVFGFGDTREDQIAEGIARISDLLT
jgi:GntR family transcriptional regulator/MocR family aminotransferase